MRVARPSAAAGRLAGRTGRQAEWDRGTSCVSGQRDALRAGRRRLLWDPLLAVCSPAAVDRRVLTPHASGLSTASLGAKPAPEASRPSPTPAAAGVGDGVRCPDDVDQHGWRRSPLSRRCRPATCRRRSPLPRRCRPARLATEQHAPVGRRAHRSGTPESRAAERRRKSRSSPPAHEFAYIHAGSFCAPLKRAVAAAAKNGPMPDFAWIGGGLR
jgi:hypothetical protein